jgi:hypothetical protein
MIETERLIREKLRNTIASTTSCAFVVMEKDCTRSIGETESANRRFSRTV